MLPLTPGRVFFPRLVFGEEHVTKSKGAFWAPGCRRDGAAYTMYLWTDDRPFRICWCWCCCCCFLLFSTIALLRAIPTLTYCFDILSGIRVQAWPTASGADVVMLGSRRAPQNPELAEARGREGRPGGRRRTRSRGRRRSCTFVKI